MNVQERWRTDGFNENKIEHVWIKHRQDFNNVFVTFKQPIVGSSFRERSQWYIYLYIYMIVTQASYEANVSDVHVNCLSMQLKRKCGGRCILSFYTINTYGVCVFSIYYIDLWTNKQNNLIDLLNWWIYLRSLENDTICMNLCVKINYYDMTRNQHIFKIHPVK